MVYLELNYESCCWCGRNKLRQTNSRRYTKAYIFYALPFLETVIAYCGCFDNLVILFFHAFNLTKCVGVLVNLAEKIEQIEQLGVPFRKLTNMCYNIE